MKIIDEKGRLFGKINVIDFLVILFLVCLVPMIYFGYKIFTKKPEMTLTPKNFVEIEINCRFIKLKPKIANIISVGDKELDENGMVIGEIIGLGKIMSYNYEFDIGGGEKLVRKGPELKQIPTRLKLRAEIKKNDLYYKDQLIKINSALNFQTDKYKVIAIPRKKLETRMIDLSVTLKDLTKDTLKKISVGDREVTETGETIAEILNLGKIESNTVELNLGSGNYAVGEESGKKQISADMRVKLQLGEDNELYFKGKNVRRSLPFEFKTDKYKVNCVVKAFEVPLSIKEKWLLLQVKFTEIIPEVANLIRKGEIEKDAFKKTVAKILTVIDNKPSKVITLRKDEFVSLNHPYYRDILVSMKVLCVKKEGGYYFKNYPVKIGNPLTFATDLYSIAGTIVGIEIK